MSSPLADWKNGLRQRVLWVDYERYAWRVFAGATEDWYRNAVKFSSTMVQALDVVRSDVVVVDVCAPFLVLLDECRDSGKFEHCESHEERIEVLFSEPEPRSFVVDVIDAMHHAVGDSADFVLMLQSPHDVLRAVGAAAEEAADFGALDGVGTVFVEMLRQLSEKPFTCLLLSSSHASALSEDEQDACEPVMKTAEYYGWLKALSFAEFSAEAVENCAADLILFSSASVAEINSTVANHVGGGLIESWWIDRQALPEIEFAVLHGEIPETAEPEAVVDAIAELTQI